MLKNVKLAVLLDCYGRLLTPKQQHLMDCYYNDDLSLSEIAENEGITRQAVRDALKHAEQQLCELEDTLHFVEKSEAMESALHLIAQTAQRLPESNEKQSILAMAGWQKEE